MAFGTKPAVWRGAALAVLPFGVVVAILWAFPELWYAGTKAGAGFSWLTEQTNIAGFSFQEIPVAKAAEAILVADRMVNGEFISSGSSRGVRTFSAKRYLKKENEIGLFSHTPDRCWTAAGWEIQLVDPQYLECTVHDLKVLFERRLFVYEGQQELVYFGALVGGQPLPYRLDQYLAACVSRSGGGGGDGASTWSRLKSNRVWGWTWASFVNRTAFGGPQQFIRISTPVQDSDLASADKLLQGFLPLWLVRGDYQGEFAAFLAAKKLGDGRSKKGNQK